MRGEFLHIVAPSLRRGPGRLQCSLAALAVQGLLSSAVVKRRFLPNSPVAYCSEGTCFHAAHSWVRRGRVVGKCKPMGPRASKTQKGANDERSKGN